MWVFEQQGSNRFKAESIESPTGWSSLLLSLGIAGSKAEATRLIRAGAIDMREAWFQEGGWEKVAESAPLPVGSPWWIRKGKAFYGVKTFMLPDPSQISYMATWEALLNEQYGHPPLVPSRGFVRAVLARILCFFKSNR